MWARKKANHLSWWFALFLDSLVSLLSRVLAIRESSASFYLSVGAVSIGFVSDLFPLLRKPKITLTPFF